MKKRELKKQILKLARVNHIDSITVGRIYCDEARNYKVKKNYLNNTEKLTVILNDLKHNGYYYIPF